MDLTSLDSVDTINNYLISSENLMKQFIRESLTLSGIMNLLIIVKSKGNCDHIENK